MQTIPLHDAAQHLSHLVAAALRGERIFITTDDHQIVRLVPIPATSRTRQAGSARGLVTITPDFDAPLEDFREYME